MCVRYTQGDFFGEMIANVAIVLATKTYGRCKEVNGGKVIVSGCPLYKGHVGSLSATHREN